MPLFLMGCFPGDSQEGKRSMKASSLKGHMKRSMNFRVQLWFENLFVERPCFRLDCRERCWVKRDSARCMVTMVNLSVQQHSHHCLLALFGTQERQPKAALVTDVQCWNGELPLQTMKPQKITGMKKRFKSDLQGPGWHKGALKVTQASKKWCKSHVCVTLWSLWPEPRHSLLSHILRVFEFSSVLGSVATLAHNAKVLRIDCSTTHVKDMFSIFLLRGEVSGPISLRIGNGVGKHGVRQSPPYRR